MSRRWIGLGLLAALVLASGCSDNQNPKITDPPITPPKPARDLYAASTSPTRIRLRWRDASDNETGFIIDRAKDSGFSVELTTVTVAANSTTYPSSGLAPNAQYWIGMAHSGQRDYKSAIAAQRKLLSAWPESQKAPDAMLSIASAQETMGDRKAAQKTLEDLVGKYPTSSAATSAKQRLAAFTKR